MTFANVGSLETKPGQRDAVLSILVRPMAGLKEAGCLLYEVGVNDAVPDTVFVCELWESAEAHGLPWSWRACRRRLKKPCHCSPVKWAATSSRCWVPLSVSSRSGSCLRLQGSNH